MKVPSLAQQLNLAVPCLLGYVAVAASPLTEMDLCDLMVRGFHLFKNDW